MKYGQSVCLCRNLKIPRIIDFIRYVFVFFPVTDFIDAKQNVSPSSDLSQLRTLKEKVQFLCQCHPVQQPAPKETKNRQKLLKRRRPSSTAGSDEGDSSSPHATQIKDLPGFCPSTAPKRQKLLDKDLNIAIRPDVEPQSPSFSTSEEENAAAAVALQSVQPNTDTARPSTSYAMSAKKREFDALTPSRLSTSFKQTSSMTADPTVPFEIFSETILDNQEFQNLLVTNINTSGIIERAQFNEGNDGALEQQLDQAMENIIMTTEANPIFEDIVREAVENQFWATDEGQMSSSTPNKSSEHETVNDEVIVPKPLEQQCESIKQRLRPRKTPAIDVTASTMKKKKAANKVEVLSDVRTFPNAQSHELIQTQEFRIQEQQQQQPLYYYYVDHTGTPCLISASNVFECDQTPATAANGNMNFPILLDGTVCIPSIISSSTTTSLDPGTILNTTDPQNAIVVNDNSQSQSPSAEPSSSCLEVNRIIVVDGDEVNAESMKGPQSTATTEQLPKANTPKQPIQSNVPCSSKSLTTPRHKISHVRVLDFTTPARSKLVDPATATYTGGLDVLNSSRMATNETPHNRTIISTIPNSAPPKIDSTKSEHVPPPLLHTETSSSMDTVINVNDASEDTVISVGSETPKVRKRHRKSCVRTLSSHKEVNAEMAAKRLKRLEKTKKKIDPEEDGSNDAGATGQTNAFKAISEEKTKEAETPASTVESAMREWELTLAARKNPALFEQLLREKNSKLQAEKDTVNADKRRTTRNARARKKATATTSTIVQNEETIAATNETTTAANGTIAAANEMLNSSTESVCNGSNTSLHAHAQMLENNLKSAKKVSPGKKAAVTKTKPKRIKKEIYIKLPESPKVKALKRQKSSTKLRPSTSEVSSTTEQQTECSQPIQEVVTVPAPSASPNPKSDGTAIARVNTSDDLEAAQDLLQLNETIRQNEKQLSARKVTPTQNDCTSTVTRVTLSDTIVRIPLTNAEFHQRSANISLSALLETPMKLDALTMFPQTPGFQMPPQLVTPMLKTTSSNPMDDSIMKNHEFPTPNFPITPGAILTPCRDVLMSPRSDQEMVYGAVNRPTDYSSSSSYYKPDESDGVDKQLQALLKASRQYSNTQSADEMIDESADVSPPNMSDGENIHERLNYSGSSSSSSSSSDSSDDNDSDSSDSSSNSSGSNLTRKSFNNDEPIETEVNNVQKPSEVTALPQEDLASTIKSHIESTQSSVVAKSILLPEPEAVVDKETERMALLAEKRLRMQQLCRQDNMAKNALKSIPKSSAAKRVRVIAEARHDTFRAPQKILSPSKRKLTQPRKLVNRTATSQLPNSQRNAGSGSAKLSTSDEMRLKAVESISANVPDQMPKCRSGDEESIDAIQNHLASDTSRNRDTTKELSPPTQTCVPSPENLIEILEDKSNALSKRSPSVKITKQIEPLPMRKLGSRCTKTQNGAKTATSKKKCGKKAKSETIGATPAKTALPSAASKSTKPADNQRKLSSQEKEPVSREIVPETPIKERHTRKLCNEIFGEISDIETPVKKSPVKANSMIEPTVHSNSAEVAVKDSAPMLTKEPTPPPLAPPTPPPHAPPTPPPPPPKESTKDNLVTSTTSSDQSESKLDDSSKLNESSETNDDNDTESETSDDSDDESHRLEKCNQSHIEHVVSKNESIRNDLKIGQKFRTMKIVLQDTTVHLTVTTEEELFRNDGPKSIDEQPSSTFGKPLLTSTPSVQKSKSIGINPKFNLKHKDHKPA